jgi:hypothetical protein
MLRTTAFIICAALLEGCVGVIKPTIDRTTKNLLEQPIICDKRTTNDIITLQDARPSMLERAATAGICIAPIGIIAGVARGDYGNRWRVISGRLGDEIDTRIEEINKTCPEVKPNPL